MLDISSPDHLHRFYERFDFAIYSWLPRSGFSVLETKDSCKGLKSANVEGQSVACLTMCGMPNSEKTLSTLGTMVLAQVDLTVSTTG